MLFLGMTRYWIEVKEGKWKMHAGVIGFKALSGAHSRDDLSRYTVGLLDCVGIMDKKSLNVSIALSYDTSVILIIMCQFHATTALCGNITNPCNNNTTCRTIQDIHTRHGLVWNSGEQQLPYVQLFFFVLALP